MLANSLLPGNNTVQSEESHEDSRLSCVETFPHPGQMTADYKKKENKTMFEEGHEFKKALKNIKAMH